MEKEKEQKKEEKRKDSYEECLRRLKIIFGTHKLPEDTEEEKKKKSD